jgi:hypothetical protein
MLYNGFVVVDTRQSPLGEYGDYGSESAYETYAGPGGAPSVTYGPNLPGSSGGSSGPLPGLGGTGWGGSQSGGGQLGGGQSRGGAGQYINADTIAAGTNLLGSVFGVIGASKAAKGPLASNVKAVCGRKPLFNIKGKKDAYFACAERVANPQPVMAGRVPEKSGNKGLIIGLIVAVVLIGIIITVVLVMKNKKAAVA